MTPTGDDPRAGSDLSERPTVVLPGQRGTGQRPASRRSRAPMPIVVGANVLWAALVSLLPVLVTVGGITLAASQHPESGSTLRYALAAWLLAHGVPLQLGGYPLTLAPLAISVLAVWRVVVGGRNSVRATGSPVLLVTAVFAVGYALLGAAAAGLASHAFVSAPVVRSAVTLALFGGVGAFAGGYGGSGLARRAWRRLPTIIADGVRAGLIGTLLLLATGALAAGISIATAGGTASQMLHSYHAGVGGQAGLVLICLVYAPNVSVWATAYLAGPGFTLAAPIQLPIFAGLPTRPVAGAWQVLLLVPVLAGAAAAWLCARRRQDRPTSTALAGVILAGPTAAVALGAAGYIAAGSLGSKLLTHTGEVGWQFPIVCGIGIGLGAVIGSIAYRLIRR